MLFQQQTMDNQRPEGAAKLNRKKRAFREGDRESLKTVQRELKVRLNESMEVYRKKLENKLQQNNVRDVWSGMKTITGFKVNGNQAEGSLDRANELNVFFNRFSSTAPSPTPCHTGPTPSLPPQLIPSHISTVIRTGDTHGATPHPSTSTSFFPAESTVPPSTSPPPCLSQAVRLGGSWRNCT